MKLSRQEFIDQFAIGIGVHCVRHWSKQRKAAPTHLATCFREQIRTSRGRMAVSAAEFARIAAPVIEALHRTTPRGQRPEWNVLAGALYDALDQSGVEVTLEPLQVTMPGHAPDPEARPTLARSR